MSDVGFEHVVDCLSKLRHDGEETLAWICVADVEVFAEVIEVGC